MASPAYNCEGLTDWVAACSKLEYFQVVIGAGPVYSTAGYKFDPKKFHQSLLPSKDTLETLSLGFFGSYHMHRDSPSALTDVTDDLPFGSFKAFYVLEHLSMRHSNLVRLPDTESMDGHGCVQRSLINVLPGSLKSLKITEIAQELIPDLVSDLLVLVKLRQVSIGVLTPVSEGMGVCLNVRVRQSKDLTSLELAFSPCK